MTHQIYTQTAGSFARHAHGTCAACNGQRCAQLEIRVCALEGGMGDVRERLGRIETTLEHVVAAVQEMKNWSAEFRAALAAQATRTEGLRTEMETIRTDLIKWFVATVLGVSALAFTAAKVIH